MLPPETERGTELDRVRGEEREQVETEVRRDDRDDAVRAEEKQQTVVELSVDPDGRGSDQRRQRNGRDSDGQGGRQDDRAGGVSATEGPRGAHHVKLPAELVAQIAKAIADVLRSALVRLELVPPSPGAGTARAGRG